MFSKLGVNRVRQLILKRYTHQTSQTSQTNVLTPTFSVDQIRDLPYVDHVDLVWKQLLPYKVKINKRKTPILFYMDYLDLYCLSIRLGDCSVQ